MPTVKNIFLSVFLITALQLDAQKHVISILDSGHATSIRGLSVVDDNIFWVSGNNGTVARSIDGGKTIEWLTVKGYEQRDFRDIEAFDASTAIIMAVAEPAIILKTKDAGKSWFKVFEDSTKGMFLDAMDFSDEENGVAIGDPVIDFPNEIYRVYTRNGGDKWSRPLDDAKYLDKTITGEAMFASSGTNVKFIKAGNTFTRNKMLIVTGGMSAKIFSQNPLTKKELPLQQGKESTGANSIAIFDQRIIAVVGGDFANDKDTAGNCALSNDAGQTWIKPQTPPHGYRSCVEYITKDKLITCGTSGVDISGDGGMNWQLISAQSFHVCQKAKKGKAVFLAGANGKIARLD